MVGFSFSFVPIGSGSEGPVMNNKNMLGLLIMISDNFFYLNTDCVYFYTWLKNVGLSYITLFFKHLKMLSVMDIVDDSDVCHLIISMLESVTKILNVLYG